MRDVFIFFLSFSGSFLAAILYHAEKKLLVFCGLSGLAGWVIYFSIYKLSQKVILATFIGAVGVALFSEILARIKKTPATIFLIAGILPIVPGVGAYNTIISFVNKRIDEAFSNALEVTACAGALAFGMILVSSSFKLLKSGMEKIKAER